MFQNLTTNNNFPKTLFIRNEFGGMIWQVYHINNLTEAERLANNATKNQFNGITLEDYQPNYKETWEDWRDTTGGKAITSNENIFGVITSDNVVLSDNSDKITSENYSILQSNLSLEDATNEANKQKKQFPNNYIYTIIVLSEQKYIVSIH